MHRCGNGRGVLNPGFSPCHMELLLKWKQGILQWDLAALGVEPSKPLAGWLRWKEESWGVFAVPLSGACSGSWVCHSSCLHWTEFCSGAFHGCNLSSPIRGDTAYKNWVVGYLKLGKHFPSVSCRWASSLQISRERQTRERSKESIFFC